MSGTLFDVGICLQVISFLESILSDQVDGQEMCIRLAQRATRFRDTLQSNKELKSDVIVTLRKVLLDLKDMSMERVLFLEQDPDTVQQIGKWNQILQVCGSLHTLETLTTIRSEDLTDIIASMEHSIQSRLRDLSGNLGLGLASGNLGSPDHTEALMALQGTLPAYKSGVADRMRWLGHYHVLNANEERLLADALTTCSQRITERLSCSLTTPPTAKIWETHGMICIIPKLIAVAYDPLFIKTPPSLAHLSLARKCFLTVIQEIHAILQGKLKGHQVMCKLSKREELLTAKELGLSGLFEDTTPVTALLPASASLTILLALMKTFSSNRRLLEHALQGLAWWCLNQHVHAMLIANCQGIETTLECIQAHTGDAKICEQLARLLWNLSIDDRNRRQIIKRHHGAEVLVAMMTQHAANTPTCEAAAAAIACLCSPVLKTIDAFISAGALAVLVPGNGYLKGFSVRTHALQALANIAQRDVLVPDMLSAGVLEHVLNTLVRDLGQEVVLEPALLCLCLLLQHTSANASGVLTTLMGMQGIKAIVNVLLEHQVLTIQRYGAACLAAITQLTSTGTSATPLPVPLVPLDAVLCLGMNMLHFNDDLLTEQVCGVLVNSCHDNEAMVVLDQIGLTALLKVCLRAVAPASLAQGLCKLLYLLTAYDVQEVLRAGGLLLMVTIMATHTAAVEIIRNCCKVIHLMSLHADSRAAVCSGVMEPVLLVLRYHVEDVETVTHALQALDNLLQESKNISIAETHNARTTIQLAAVRHAGDVAISKAAEALLSVLFVEIVIKKPSGDVWHNAGRPATAIGEGLGVASMAAGCGGLW